MNGKSSISSSYLEETKARYLSVSTEPPPIRSTLIMGWAKRNIGDDIMQSLEEAGHHVNAWGQDQCLAGNAEDLDLFLYDTIVFVNGETHLDWIEAQSFNDICSVVHNTLTSSMLGASQFVRATLDAPHKKHIVFIGSMGYNHVLNGSAPYCAAKAGLAMFSKCLAYELAPKNYDVFCVHPSNTEGMPMSEQTIKELMRFRNLTRQQAEAYWAAELPRERWLQGYDIGGVVAWLVSGQATYMSGSNVELSGGQR